jgi:hypothetical protein
MDNTSHTEHHTGDEYEIETSPLSQTLSRDGHTISVDIYRGDSGWILEVVDEHNNSTVWEDEFDTDQAALDELHATLQSEGIQALIGL